MSEQHSTSQNAGAADRANAPCELSCNAACSNSPAADADDHNVNSSDANKNTHLINENAQHSFQEEMRKRREEIRHTALPIGDLGII